MKLFFLPFLALMLCNFCSSTPTKVIKDKAKLLRLPDELFVEILGYLGLKSLHTTLSVDKKFNHYSSDEIRKAIPHCLFILEPIKNDEKDSKKKKPLHKRRRELH